MRILACILLFLTACSGTTTTTFHFDSNVKNLTVMIDGKSCETPCNLSFEKHSPITVIFSSGIYDVYGQDKNTAKREKKAAKEKQVEGQTKENDGNSWGKDLLLTTMLPTVTVIFVVAGAISISSDGKTSTASAIQYDFNRYYIYSYNDSSVLIPKYSDIIEFSLINYDALLMEQHQTETPFIKSLAIKSGVREEKVATLVGQSTGPLEFMDSVMLEVFRNIMGSNTTNEKKIEEIAKALHHSKYKLMDDYKNSQSDEDFLRKVAVIMENKRIKPRAPATDKEPRHKV